MCLVKTCDLHHSSCPFLVSFDSAGDRAISRPVEIGEVAGNVDVIIKSVMLVIYCASSVRVGSNESRARTLTRKFLEPAQ